MNSHEQCMTVLNHGMRKRIGIDLGGSSIKLGLVNENYQITKRMEIPLQGDRSFDGIMDLIEIGVNRIREGEDIVSAGIGIPATILDRRIAAMTPNLDWFNCDVASEMSRRFDFPCTVDNDADCAGMAEYLAGAGRGTGSMAMLTLGSGVGSSVVYNGKILRGSRDCGVEFGHIKIVVGGELCGCGSRGCAEAYCSASALKREVRYAVRAKRKTVLKKWVNEERREPEARLVFDAAELGDAVGNEILTRYIECLTALVSSVVLSYRPEIIVVGGGISAAGDRLFKPVNDGLEDATFGAELIGCPRVVPAVLGNDAGIIGAAYMEM